MWYPLTDTSQQGAHTTTKYRQTKTQAKTVAVEEERIEKKSDDLTSKYGRKCRDWKTSGYVRKQLYIDSRDVHVDGWQICLIINTSTF